MSALPRGRLSLPTTCDDGRDPRRRKQARQSCTATFICHRLAAPAPAHRPRQHRRHFHSRRLRHFIQRRRRARASAVNHLSYAVTDYARTRDFYVDLLGMQVVWDNGKMCAVEFGDPARPEGLYIVPVKPGEKSAVSYIGYSIDNFPGNKEKIAAALTRQKIKFKADTAWCWTLDDRAGDMIHFNSEAGIFPGASDPCAIIASDKCKGAEAIGLKNLASLPTPGAGGFKATTFSHIVLCVYDIVKTRDWYEQMFSMQPFYFKGGETECTGHAALRQQHALPAQHQAAGRQALCRSLRV